MRSRIAFCSAGDMRGSFERSAYGTFGRSALEVTSRMNAAKVPRGSERRLSVSVRSLSAKYFASSSLFAMRIAQFASASRTLVLVICAVRWCASIIPIF
jgi:hypothetical protein